MESWFALKGLNAFNWILKNCENATTIEFWFYKNLKSETGLSKVKFLPR